MRSVTVLILLIGCSSAPRNTSLALRWEEPERVRIESGETITIEELLRRLALRQVGARDDVTVHLEQTLPLDVVEKMELRLRAARFETIRLAGALERLWTRTCQEHWLEEFKEVSERAFLQEKLANIVIIVEVDGMYHVGERRELSEAELMETIRKSGGGALAVVILTKYWWKGRDKAVDRIEKKLRASRFGKVVVQQYHSRGRPIDKE